MALDQVKTLITGSGVVGAASMTCYFTSATSSNLTALRTLIDAVKAFLPTTTTYAVQGSGNTIDEATGHLVGGWSAAAPAPVVGTGVSIPAKATGFLIKWTGGGVINGGRPIGKMIFVPGSNAAPDATGVIASSTVTAVNAAATTFLGSAVGFVTWHRPVYDTEQDPPVLVRPGGFLTPTTGTCMAKVAVLRSRRD